MIPIFFVYQSHYSAWALYHMSIQGELEGLGADAILNHPLQASLDDHATSAQIS